MACNARKFVKVTKFLLAGVTVFCVSWIACVNEWRGAGGGRWRRAGPPPAVRTIVAYSEGKLAEMERPSPVTCDRLPAFPAVPHIDRAWRRDAEESVTTWQRVASTRVFLYSAYYDDRQPQRYVRILAAFHGRNFSEDPLYCQTRQLHPYEDSVEVVAAKPLEIWSRQWDVMSSDVETPILLSCPLTGPLYYPSIVSVVTEPCDDPTNAFLVEPRTETDYKRNFTICVKDMNFNKDISQNLLEWVETNRILGVDLIDLYIDNISRESENILLHYRDKGYVRLFHVPIKDKPNRSLWQRRRDHIITYNDCLYRNIGESVYVVPLDVDEVVLPKIAYTWPELIERLKHNGWDPAHNSAILVQNVFFFGFMQGVHEYKHKKLLSKNKIYVKRDDVRIRKTQNVDIGEIELVDGNNLSEVIDQVDNDEKLYEEYKARCGKEMVVPKLVKHIVSSALVSPVGYYGKSLMVTRKVLTAFNHYPLASLGGSPFAGWAAPFEEVQLNHYKVSCNSTVVVECAQYGRRARIDRAAWRLRRQLTAALSAASCLPINYT